MTGLTTAFVVCPPVLVLASAMLGTPRPQVPTLTAEGDAGAGHVRLQWLLTGATADTEFLLQQATSPDFSTARTQYQGRQRASVLSGLTDGTYYYRVRARTGPGRPWGAWSATQRFAVKHHAHSLAFSLLGLGAAAFLLTSTFLLVSARKAKS